MRACAATEDNLDGLRAEQLLIENQMRDSSQDDGAVASDTTRLRRQGLITMSLTHPPGERSIHEPRWRTKRLHADQS